MSSVITIQSKWRDAAWSPEQGSPLNPIYTYWINGELHTLSDEEKQAGERVGYQTFEEYAQTPTIYQQGKGGWQMFDDRPGAVESMDVNGDTHYSKAEDIAMIELRKQGYTFATIAKQLRRNIGGVTSRYSRIRKFYL
jgi:hypothetical protein